MEVASKLLRWYRRHARDLPWRYTRDPYRVLVSEIMLQQTQVDRVVDFYGRWLKQFPTWKKLSTATNAQVIRAWAGLGYNRRALILRDVARDVVEYGLPDSEEGWLAIKGIGPYTAAAVSAFAQRQRTLPIDTNIRRVLGRLLLGKPFATLTDDEAIRSKADDFLPHRGDYYDVPQAIFDLATAVCTKNPACARCPLRNDCPSAKLFLEGRVKIPKRSIAVARERHHRNKPFPDRIYRGRILKIVREWGPTVVPSNGTLVGRQVGIRELGSLVDPDFDKKLDQKWIEAMVERLMKDGLVIQKGSKISL
ncbi:MAG: A/G-specific adenine glycosylase [Candidatus Uhrbacteria bacterium]|nr:A/G-specific adenine glycosylase [Candidatus Uhrbacteria bacterium]